MMIEMELDNITSLDFSRICRTCLQDGNALTSIFDSKAADMLNYCDFCLISENDGFPNQICQTCLQLLEQNYKFKKQCENSHSILVKCNNSVSSHQENSLDSNEVHSDLEESSCTNCDRKFVDSDSLNEHRCEAGSELKVPRTTNQDKEDFEEIKEDLISFLEKPLPPPCRLPCEHCDQSFSEENDLQIHQSVHSDELICLGCSKKFTSRKILKRHLKIHLIKKPHICKICSKSFPESYALTKHLRRHSGIPREKRHFCPECGQGFSEPYYLNVHLRKHTGERPLVCSVCNKAFADPRSLKIHNMTHTGERPYKCDFCQKTFRQNANLTKHIRIHTGEKPYVCKQCNKRFSQSSSLEKHRRTHTGEKLFSCDKCYKRFSEKSTLKNHVKTHKDDACQQCFSLFKSKSELLAHYKPSGVENACQICGKKFSTSCHLLVHTQTHSKEKLFECATCFQKFSHKSSLEKHTRTHYENNLTHFEPAKDPPDCADNLYNETPFL